MLTIGVLVMHMWGEVDLRNLPSPPLLYRSSRHGNAKLRRSQLLTASMVLAKYVNLSDKSRTDLIRKWVKSVEKNHLLYQSNPKRSKMEILDKSDLSKIDFLLVATGQNALFESNDEIVALYNLEPASGRNFAVKSSSVALDESKPSFQSGVHHYFDAFSFDPEHRIPLAQFLLWIKSGQLISKLNPNRVSKLSSYTNLGEKS